MRDRPLDLLVPAYVHPAADPVAWERLVAWAPFVRAVVLNVHNGPGDPSDPYYPRVVQALRAAGVRILGYVDTDYGRRSAADVSADVDAWVARYTVHGIFLDQTASTLDLLDHYSDLALACRSRGADFVALNPGTTPHPGYLDLANVTVTFEGTWADYPGLAEPSWVRALPARRFAHLVHEVPDAKLGSAVRLAAGRHVGSVMVTTGSGANPWEVLPEDLARTLADSVG